MSFRVYVDLEYLYPEMTRESGRPGESELRQIVQIGAILVDEQTAQEQDHLNILVLPTFTSQLPDFFVELTDITQTQVDEQGVELTQALESFETFVKDFPVWTFDKDENVFRQNYGYIHRAFPFSSFIRVKPQLANWDIDPEKYSSGTLYQAAGLNMQGHVHNALHDVRSMAAAVHAFERK